MRKKCKFLLVLTISSLSNINGVCEMPETLVVDCSDFNGKVLSYEIGPTSVASTSVWEAVSRFELGPNGHYVFQNTNRKWYTGKIGYPSSVTPISPTVIPHSLAHVAVSQDASLIAWISAYPEGALLVTAATNSHTNPIYYIRTNGCIGTAAWSPNDRQLAFYCGPAQATFADGYSLMLLNLRSTDPIMEELAPPSKPTRLSPIRPDPPLWSPDGASILFEACYEGQNMSNPYNIVHVKTKRRIAAGAGSWSADSKRLHTITSNGTSESGYRYRASAVDVLTDRVKQLEVGFDLPRNPWSLKWSVGEKMFAYTTSEGVYLVRGESKKTLRLGPVGPNSKIYWVRN